MRIPFESSIAGMFGLALELQIVDQESQALVRRGSDIIASLDQSSHASRRVRTGARQDFLELVSGEHEHPAGLLAQMSEIRSEAIRSALANQSFLSGAGAHPGTFWMEANAVRPSGQAVESELAASFYAARVFVGVKSGDEAIRLIRLLTPYVPHLIALSASSPVMTGQSVGMVCARLLSRLERGGTTSMPTNIQTWDDFEHYIALLGSGGRSDPADLGWDMVPRPELGTVEIRVMDASLTVERACSLAGFVQALSQWVLRQDDMHSVSPSLQSVNRAQACFLGLNADYLRLDGGRSVPLRQELLALMDEVLTVADEIGSVDQIDEVASWVQTRRCDADWLHQQAIRVTRPEGIVQRMVARFDASQGSDITSDLVHASELRPFSSQRIQADQRFRALLANRLAPGMTITDFDRQL
ncbi:glutamate-cysteine ligase family protein [Orrella marina]|uniref:Glutamate--cysteine ligase n=1 Tax=Orrella marina TaxID=2163011 RepID=A0A2R4XMJ1_9BURK|nr:glutamate-cysteine ligase family protein [Orrella marina]AWB34984.1 hypothetical protein DBV39_16015 [Orrella marina]